MLGIVGGGFGRFLQKVSPCKSIIFDVNPEKSDTTLEDFLNRVDSVIIAVENNRHFDLCKFFLENNKDVLCLKPFVSSTSQVSELYSLAETLGRKLKIGFNQRYRKELENLPKDTKIIANWESFNRKIFSPIDFYNVKFDLGVHFLDLALYLGSKSIIYKKEIYSKNRQQYKVTLDNYSCFKTTFNKQAGTDILSVTFLDSNKKQIGRIKEEGSVENWEDSYTFTRMISDFLCSDKDTCMKDFSQIYKLTELLCW